MTPERRRDFESEWPELAARLHRMLARRGLPVTVRDDVVQETAARLYGTWEDVDRSRPAWPLTRAIALNHLRDQARRKIQEVASEIPEIAHHHNVEDAGLARIELGKVRDALDDFTPQAREAVLVEIGAARACRASAAEKMQRMRARKKLKLIIERTPAAVALRFSRLADLGEWLVGGRAALNSGLSCLACAAIGMVAVMPSASSSGVTLERVVSDPDRGTKVVSTLGDTSSRLVALSVADEHELVVAARRDSDSDATAAVPSKKKKGKANDPGGGTGDKGLLPGAPPPPALPTNGAAPEVAPEFEDPHAPPGGGGEAPGLPSVDPGEGEAPIGALSGVEEKLEEIL